MIKIIVLIYGGIALLTFLGLSIWSVWCEKQINRDIDAVINEVKDQYPKAEEELGNFRIAKIMFGKIFLTSLLWIFFLPYLIMESLLGDVYK